MKPGRAEVGSVRGLDIRSDRQPPGQPMGIGTSSGGGGMDDDILRRLGTLEKDMSDVKVQIGSIAAQIPHLPTKADVSDVRTSVSDLRAFVNEVKTSIVQWVVGTTIAVAALAFAIAKFVH
jgi:hypothetical protein